MKRKTFARRKKGVVSLYVDLRLWHRFGEACTERQTTRGLQLTQFLENRMKQWERNEENHE